MPQDLVKLYLVHFHYFKNWNVNNLQAPYWRFYWNTNSKASVVHRGKRYSLKPDHVYLIPAHASYAAVADGEIGHLYIHFGFAWACVDRSPMSFRLDVSMRKRLKRLVHLLEDWHGFESEVEDLPPEVRLLAQSLVTQVMGLAPFDRFQANSKNLAMERVAKTMADHLASGVDTRELAESEGMSLSTFRQRFAKHFGMTPHRYLTMLRLDRAATMLGYTENSIDLIAQETGFSDRYHLTKVFSRYRGTTPAAYRKRHVAIASSATSYT